MAASHIMTSLMKAPTPSMGDLADVYILQKMGYKSFMFSDSLSQDKKAFPLAVTAMQQFISRYGTPTPPHPSHTSTSSSPFGYF
ncbi:hypothetical protein Pelo_16344 [Pelomyxa schiedti]|nr:hypothetical protein Pelo_16344 [Pelomyxa schiedti]